MHDSHDMRNNQKKLDNKIFMGKIPFSDKNYNEFLDNDSIIVKAIYLWIARAPLYKMQNNEEV